MNFLNRLSDFAGLPWDVLLIMLFPVLLIAAGGTANYVDANPPRWLQIRRERRSFRVNYQLWKAYGCGGAKDRASDAAAALRRLGA